jgi:hypothetical protein
MEGDDVEPTASPSRRPARLGRGRLGAVAAFATLVAAGVAVVPGAAHADPVLPPLPLAVVPCATLGPVDWDFFEQPVGSGSGVHYIIHSSTPTLDVAHGRFIENPTGQPITGNWTASEARTVTMTSSVNLTIAGNGGRADPQELALTITLATGLQVTQSRTTSVGVGASATVPPQSTMLGEYGLRSLDVVFDMQVVVRRFDMVTCELRSIERNHTAHVPTINEGWRFTLI